MRFTRVLLMSLLIGFVEIVADGRKMTEETVREIADGRNLHRKTGKSKWVDR